MCKCFVSCQITNLNMFISEINTHINREDSVRYYII